MPLTFPAWHSATACEGPDTSSGTAEHLKTIILPLIINQKDTDTVTWIITFINRSKTWLQRIHRIIDGYDQ